MSMTLHHQLPLPDQLKAQIPLSPELAASSGRGTRRSATCSPERTTGLSRWWAPARRTTRTRCAPTSIGWLGSTSR